MNKRIAVKKKNPYAVPDLKKITTYIKKDTARKIKIMAATRECPDYVIIQRALDLYFKKIEASEVV